MSFEQFKLDKSISQSRGIFDKYIYKTDDTIAQVSAAGYFGESRFAPEGGWEGSIVEAQCSDGFITGSIGASSTLTVIYSPTTPLANVTVIQSLSDFPDPVGGVITLVENELYQINGFVDIATNRLVINGNNPFIGKNGGHDGLTYTGTGDMFTSETGEALTLIALAINCPNGTVFNMDGGGSGLLFVQQNCAFIDGAELGSISNMQAVQFDNNIFSSNGDGFTFGGANNARLSFTKNTINGNAGTFIDLTTGVWESIVLNGNQAVNTPSGATFLSGAANSANITNSGLVEANIFSGVGTYLDTITNEDLKWEFLGNKGNNGTQNSQREGGAFISASAATVITTGSGDAGNPIPIVGTFTNKIAKRFTSDAAGELTYIGLEEASVNVMVIADLDPSSGANKVYKIGIAIDGTVDEASQIQLSVDNNNPSPVSCQFPVAMTTGQTAQAYIENITDETNVTATSLSIVAR